jgi:hypothetical protein
MPAATVWAPSVKNNTDVVPVDLTLSQLSRALDATEYTQANLKKRGKEHFNNSIEEGRATFAGLLGEEVIYDFFAAQGEVLSRTPSWHPYDYDFKMASEPELTLDVKTKRCSGPPDGHFNATVWAGNIDQKCNIYVFTRLAYEPSRDTRWPGWIVGWLPKRKFLRMAFFGPRGELDPTASNGYRFSDNCWNVPILQLWPVTTLQQMQADYAVYLENEREK